MKYPTGEYQHRDHVNTDADFRTDYYGLDNIGG